MMQMLKVNADPKNAMMVLKDGTRIAMKMMRTHVSTRIAHLNSPRA